MLGLVAMHVCIVNLALVINHAGRDGREVLASDTFMFIFCAMEVPQTVADVSTMCH